MPIVGEIRTFAFNLDSLRFIKIVHSGWIPCDGRSLTKSEHRPLHRTIGEDWGTFDPDNTFCVPNLSGSFLRCLSFGPIMDDSEERSLDPDFSSRLSPRPSLPGPGAFGNQVGSFQEDDVRPHEHVVRGRNDTGSNSRGNMVHTGVGGGGFNREATTTLSTGTESRPKNHYILYMIYGGAELPQMTIQNIFEDYSVDSSQPLDDID